MSSEPKIPIWLRHALSGAAVPLVIMLVRAPLLLAQGRFVTSLLGDAVFSAALGGAAGGLAYSFVGRHFIHRPYWGFAAAGVPCSLAFFSVMLWYGALTGHPLTSQYEGTGFWLVFAVFLGLPLGWGLRRGLARDHGAT